MIATHGGQGCGGGVRKKRGAVKDTGRRKMAFIKLLTLPTHTHIHPPASRCGLGAKGKLQSCRELGKRAMQKTTEHP